MANFATFAGQNRIIMYKTDKKTLMMDAGMTMFESTDNFGLCLGQVKAEMSEYGKVLTQYDIDSTEVPESTGEFDFFLDRTTFWRKRYISCRLESAGQREVDGETIYKYAVSFREGNRSTFFRGAVMTLIISGSIAGLFLSHGPAAAIIEIVIAAAAAYCWIMPSRTAPATVRSISDAISGGRNGKTVKQ